MPFECTNISRCRPARDSKRLSAASFLSSQTRRSTLEHIRVVKSETNIAAHFLNVEQLCQYYNTDATRGLSDERAMELLEVHGPNQLLQTMDTTLLKLLVNNLFGWFPSMLWFAAILSIIIHFIQHLADSYNESNENLYLGIIITCVVVFTGLFAFYQEAKNYQVMKGFKDLIPRSANVIRDGVMSIVPVDVLVLGDVVVMFSGEVVPADVRLIEVTSFKIDMSSITGEAEPQSRTTEYTNQNPLETKNLAFFSCTITSGKAKGIVVATGQNTVIGRIAGLVTEVEKEETPIAMEIKNFLKILTVIAIFLGTIFFILVAIIQSSWVAGFYYMTGIIIANVPEGLLVTLTVSLTLTAKKLQKKNCLVKKLQAVETLGAISCICSDKTGTLTENRMSVSHIACNFKLFDANTDEINPHDDLEFLRCACLCLSAEFIDSTAPIHEREIKGDASEKAVLRYMEEKHTASYVRKHNPKVCEILFNSATKFQLSVHVLEGREQYIIVMKGAPEIIMDVCQTIRITGNDVELNPETKRNLKKQIIELGHMGERVLGFCDLLLPQGKYPLGFKFDTENPNFPMTGFRFLGFISLIDPPRKSVPLAISKCRSAGIKVIMVTGDHPITALAISRKVGIISEKNETPYDEAFKLDVDPKEFSKNVDISNYKAVVITGEVLRSITTHSLDHIIDHVDEITFARTSPQQKLLIVESCQRLGHVVAVTGDGVNDSPALKRADIGIAMGITGTDVSKQAADMILLDDDFSSIILGVEEGRLIFDNLKKSISFTLTSNLTEMLPFIMYATIGVPLPLHALLIIAINVLTDLWPAISLAYEKAEADTMSKPPRNLNIDHLVTWNLINLSYFQIGMIQFIAAMTTYFVTMASFGFFPRDILFSRQLWNSMAVSDFPDSYGQEWTFEERKTLETLAQSTYYAAIVVVQIADVTICKTRRLSLLQQGMTNHVLNCGILFEIGISLVILYIPLFNKYFYTEPIPFLLWLPPVPFAFLLMFVDELRKYFIRKHPGGWVEKELYW